MTLSADFAAELRAALGDENVVTEPEQLRVYECDGLTGHRAVPELVALPAATEEVQAVVRACQRTGLPFVARGAGTGLSGGATPVAGGVVISLARMDRILEIDLASQRIVVEPGVANLDVTRAVAADGFWPTELNPRFGAGINTIARAGGELPILLLNELIGAGIPIGRTAAELEAELVAAADTHRGGGTWRANLPTTAEVQMRPLADQSRMEVPLMNRPTSDCEASIHCPSPVRSRWYSALSMAREKLYAPIQSR